MDRVNFLRVLTAACGVCAALPALAAPQGRRPAAPDAATVATERDEASFDAILARVRAAAESGEAAKPGWSDAALEKSIDALIDEVRQATKRDDVKSPVSFAEVKPGVPVVGGRTSGILLVTTECRLPFVEKSILLVDGNAQISSATDCLIVARGAVQIAHGQGNVVLAGQWINVSHDGGRRRDGAGVGASALLSGGGIDVAHANGTTMSAPRSVDVSHASGVTFLNCPDPDVQRHLARVMPRQEPNAAAAAHGLKFLPRARPNPIEGRLKITQVVSRDDKKQDLVTYEHDGAELVLRPGAEPKDAAGQPLPGLEGWKLSFIEEDFALFTRGRDDAGFHVPRKR